MTTVINMFGGPGVGKSTLALGVAHLLKREGHTCEYIREAAKIRAYAQAPIDAFEQFHITAEQIKMESQYYGHCEFIVSDSPLELQAFYDFHRSQSYVYLDLITQLRSVAFRDPGVARIDFMLARTGVYSGVGRYESEAEAWEVDTALEVFLEKATIETRRVDPYGINDCMETIREVS